MMKWTSEVGQSKCLTRRIHFSHEINRKAKNEIYQKHKAEFSYASLSLAYGARCNNIKYLIHLIDRHGFESAKHTYHYYSKKFKLKTIKESDEPPHISRSDYYDWMSHSNKD